MFQEGDIVEIPLPDGRIAIGWILHISQHFKNAVGFIVFGIKGQVADELILDPTTRELRSMKVLGTLYTHLEAIQHYGWGKFANQPLSDRHRWLTKREVGGGVYVGDEYLGPVAEVGDSNLKPMRAMGMQVIYTEIERAFGKLNFK